MTSYCVNKFKLKNRFFTAVLEPDVLVAARDERGGAVDLPDFVGISTDVDVALLQGPMNEAVLQSLDQLTIYIEALVCFVRGEELIQSKFSEQLLEENKVKDIAMVLNNLDLATRTFALLEPDLIDQQRIERVEKYADKLRKHLIELYDKAYQDRLPQDKSPEITPGQYRK